MDSRQQRERKGGSPPISAVCKSLGAYESEWILPPARTANKGHHKLRGGEGNHGKFVFPGESLDASEKGETNA